MIHFTTEYAQDGRLGVVARSRRTLSILRRSALRTNQL